MQTMLTTLSKNRMLVIEMTRRDITERFVGHFMGIFWFLVHSVLTMSIYIFLFSFVYRGNVGQGNSLFSLYLLSGLVPWMFLTETMNRGVSVILSNSSLVKQVVFPIEVLPFKTVCSSLVTLFFNVLILLGYYFYKSEPSIMLLLLPLTIFFLVLLAWGLVLVLSVAGAYLRDLRDIVQVFSSLGLYLLPVVFFEQWVPSLVKPLVMVNPFTYVVFCFQDIFYYRSFHHPIAWVLFPLISLLSCFLGQAFFTKVKINLGNFV